MMAKLLTELSVIARKSVQKIATLAEASVLWLKTKQLASHDELRVIELLAAQKIIAVVAVFVLQRGLAIVTFITLIAIRSELKQLNSRIRKNL